MTPLFQLHFLHDRIEAKAQTLIGALRIEAPSRESLDRRLGSFEEPEDLPRVARALLPVGTVATDLEVTLRPDVGIGAPKFLPSSRFLERDEPSARRLPALYCDERHWLLFELPFDHHGEQQLSRRNVVEVEIAWISRPTESEKRLVLRGEVELVHPSLVGAPNREVAAALDRCRRLGGEGR